MNPEPRWQPSLALKRSLSAVSFLPYQSPGGVYTARRRGYKMNCALRWFKRWRRLVGALGEGGGGNHRRRPLPARKRIRALSLEAGGENFSFG